MAYQSSGMYYTIPFVRYAKVPHHLDLCIQSHQQTDLLYLDSVRLIIHDS